ncbi:hypothetical protein AVEN_263836-1 [Araneus ventricosus]|uniref:Uncharacterized protein n=1 Tax=Araneus ventricosus TaxID=182803 RepID=A0A4Y2DYM9_ARAVE|nr:hypothetical protein AVEN_263836-1 [Araneus ventricosus]
MRISRNGIHHLNLGKRVLESVTVHRVDAYVHQQRKFNLFLMITTFSHEGRSTCQDKGLFRRHEVKTAVKTCLNEWRQKQVWTRDKKAQDKQVSPAV